MLFTNDIKMESGIESGSRREEKVGRSEGIKLSDEKVIKSLQDNKDDKDIGILQVYKVRWGKK